MKKLVNIQQMKSTSLAFFLAHQRCDESRPLANGQIQRLMVPAIVCIALSIEIGIKVILLNENYDFKYEHDLKKLFSQISQETQGRIRKNAGSSLCKNEFENSLGKAAATFAKWRYIYEYDDAEAEPQFLVNLAKAILIEIKMP